VSTGMLALQKAVYAALKNDAALTAELGAGVRIFDHIPQAQTWPYIRIGDDTRSDWGTQDGDGSEVELMIHSWHRSPNRGRAPVHTIMDHVYRILHRSNLEVEGFTTVLIRNVFSEILVEEDLTTYHGVQRFRVLLANNEEG